MERSEEGVREMEHTSRALDVKDMKEKMSASSSKLEVSEINPTKRMFLLIVRLEDRERSRKIKRFFQMKMYLQFKSKVTETV